MESYPLAERATPVNESEARLCVHCGERLVTGTWDRFNGFLVECPHCHRNHGKRWNARALALGSFALNALSFFFTMRPWRAFIALIAWTATFTLLLPRIESAPDAIQFVVLGSLILGPLLINMTLLVRHEVHLDRPARPAGRNRHA
jgi:hypothetical protein